MKNLDKGISQIVFPNKDMAEPERPDPPCVDKVTHCSIELSWGGAGPEGDAKGDGRRKYCVQEEEEGKDREYGTVYNGFAINHVFRGLEPNTTYHYRIRVSNNHGCSAWSASISVSTTKVPLTGQDIHKAIVNWEVEKVKHILDESDDSLVNVPDVYGMSPLMIASQKGYTSIVEILIERGADVNYVSGSGKTSLMLACFGGHLKVATILHEHGVILTYKDNGGSNALHWAVDGDRDDCIRWLLNCGVKVDEADDSGWSPLVRLATVDGSEHTARTLLDYGADVNKRDKTGRTALMAAALNGNLRLCQLLIQHGADQTLTNENGRTCLDFAESFGRKDVAQFLMTAGQCKRGP
ncbi:fibronectin type 3 and ankyrin repeat domains 1 protein isoform X2 [Nematostella vectensis]|uniref:fibronectin type 3 and ankyrin repeat domains 1 protein isoform X2 n=1 Tax=Nematostella vectensis TaxID=45351 RepID=UPI0020778B28|nr:fibronectin type 3 and ankyrin repeat domains 1 protein isoform X2 [Nematostella vectensis]